MHRLFLALLVAGCTTAAPVTPPCACVVIPEMNGLMSVSLDGVPMLLDGDPEPARSMPVNGVLRDTAQRLTLVGGGEHQVWSSNGIEIGTVLGDGFDATWGDGDTFDITRPAAMNELGIDTAIRSDTEYDAGIFLELGPRGGSAQVTEIVSRSGGGWRVRGSYTAQACDVDNARICHTVTGTFAFDAPTLPTNGNVEAFVPAG